MRVWEEGRDRDERIALREAEDTEAHRLMHLDRTDPLPGPSRLLTWTRELNAYREALTMARGRKPKAASVAAKLITALDFVSAAQKDTGQGAFQTHVRLAGRQAIASDGILGAGHPIDEDLSCCPHTVQLKVALQKCGASLSITETENGRLAIAGEKLKAFVPCMPPEGMAPMDPDPNLYPIPDTVRAALGLAALWTREGGERVLESAVLLAANSCYGTNGHALIEAWHGVNMPELIVPRAFIVAINKVTAPVIGFGFSPSTLTFHFEGGAWIKTQLYVDGFPASAKTLPDAGVAPMPIPDGLLAAVEAVAHFNERGHVSLMPGMVRSEWDMSNTDAATYDVEQLAPPHVLTLDAKLVLAVKDHIKAVDMTSARDRMFFFGGTVRGVIMSIRNG